MQEDSPQLEITVLEGEGCARIVLRGELDVATAAVLSERLAAVNRTGVSELTVDLSGLSYLDPAGVSPLVAEQQRATASGMTLRIESPTAFVRDLLTVTGLIDYLGVPPRGDEGP
ncbi:MAG: STAS domain-containing protein [Acidimicrobiales bacterium]